MVRALCREHERYPLGEACEQARRRRYQPEMSRSFPSGKGEKGWNRAKSASLAQACAGGVFLSPAEEPGRADSLRKGMVP